MKISELNEDAMWLRWQHSIAEIYDELTYKTNPIVSYVNKYGHGWVESQFTPKDFFSKVLEVGAGTGQHLPYVKHGYDQYFLTDLNLSQLEVAKKSPAINTKVVVEAQDALHLKYPDATFDRLISISNLEHLPNPHTVLKEWKRVVKPGGTISLSIPTEGGIAWRLGRYLTTRRHFKKKGLDLDYIIAREHINACYRLVSLIKHYFPDRQESWFPLGIALSDINLIYSCNIAC